MSNIYLLWRNVPTVPFGHLGLSAWATLEEAKAEAHRLCYGVELEWEWIPGGRYHATNGHGIRVAKTYTYAEGDFYVDEIPFAPKHMFYIWGIDGPC